MAQYLFKTPEGKSYRINAPEGATPEQAFAFAKNAIAQQSQQPKPGTFEGFKTGLADTAYGGEQLLRNILPESVVKGIDVAGNALSRVTGGLISPREGTPQFEEALKKREQAYQSGRAAEGDTGVDWDRMLGNILSPTSLALGGPVAKAATLGGKAIAGALTGAASGAMMPTSSGDFEGEKKSQLLYGAAGGAAAPVAGRAISRLISPKTSDAAKLLIREGVHPTPGAVVGGASKRLEEIATSTPILGSGIVHAKTRAMHEFNRAIGNRVLRPLRSRLPEELKTGDTIYGHLEYQINKAYENAWPKLSARLDKPLVSDLNNIASRVQKSVLGEQEKTRILAGVNDIASKAGPNGEFSKDALQYLKTTINAELRTLQGKGGFVESKMANHVRELRNALQRSLERHSGKDAIRELNNADAAFKRFMIFENARTRGSIGKPQREGSVLPTELLGAIKADKGVSKRAFSKGKNVLQDLAEAGVKVLGKSEPDSGTAQRTILPTAALGVLAAPQTAAPIAAGLGLGGGAYWLGPTQRAMTALAGQRPAIAAPFAGLLEQASGRVAPGVGGLFAR